MIGKKKKKPFSYWHFWKTICGILRIYKSHSPILLVLKFFYFGMIFWLLEVEKFAFISYSCPFLENSDILTFITLSHDAKNQKKFLSAPS